MTRHLPRRALRAKPLMVALAAAWPLLCLAQIPGVPMPAPPTPSTVPVPMAGWRVYGEGAAAPINSQPNALGGIDQTIQQTSKQGIYNWETFNIGAASSVTFDMAQTGSSALNRVMGGQGPSQIFGRLSATNGGEIYIINSSGILFGRGAQVNTGSLIASALDLTDEEYKSNLTNALMTNAQTPAFSYSGAPEHFIDSKNFVRVDEGASITTANGGRIFLFAKRVENAGTLTTPGGQTVLAAGSEVFLQAPSLVTNTYYASESNGAVPILRGLLVEVGDKPITALSPEGSQGSVSNSGTIHTPRGNTTLVGMAVNQLGRISATSSVTENGSVILRAQGAYDPNWNAARAAGNLTLGEGSVIEITPDEGREANGGQAQMSDGNATFIAPTVILGGANVVMESGAKVHATGGVVDIRASATIDNTAQGSSRGYASDPTTQTGRFIMADGAAIDVSGDSGQASVARYFATTGLLGGNDLANSPVQRDGLLYRSQVTLDVREDSAILGSLESYRNAIPMDIHERLSAGGQVRVSGGSAVLMHDGARIDVSGGSMTYSAADVQPTLLVAADGSLYSLNDAPKDLIYTQGLSLRRSGGGEYDRWGLLPTFGSAAPMQHEEGYTEGRSAGSLTVVAPTTVLAGQIDAHRLEGERQKRGEDAAAKGADLTIGAAKNGPYDFYSADFTSAVLNQFNVSATAPTVDEALWATPLEGELPTESGMSLATLKASGATQITLAANGDVALHGEDGEALDLADRGSLRLLSKNGDATLDADVSSAGGSVEVHAKAQTAVMSAASQVDLSGHFVNHLLDGGASAGLTTAGGQFSAVGGRGVVLHSGSAVDVSGGASVAADGKLTGAAAGGITLSVTSIAPQASDPGLVMGGQFSAQSLTQGGSLSIKAPRVVIDANAADDGQGPPPIMQTKAADSAAAAQALYLTPDFFTQDGFSSYSVDGNLGLTVTAGTQIAPHREALYVDPLMASRLTTGSQWQSIAQTGLLPGQAPAAMTLALRASGTSPSTTLPSAESILQVEEGARIRMERGSSVSLEARHALLMDGHIESSGGKVALAVTGRELAQGSDATLWMGASSLIDVSGSALTLPSANGLQTGTVSGGGSIALNASASAGAYGNLVVASGAQLSATGASATYDRQVLTPLGAQIERQQIDTAGGRISLTAQSSLVVEGELHAAGGGQARGGAVAVQVVAPDSRQDAASAEPHVLSLASATAHSGLTNGVSTGDLESLHLALQGAGRGPHDAHINASTLAQSQASDVRLGARDAIAIEDGVDLQLTGSLSLSAPALRMAEGSLATLAADQILVEAKQTSALTPQSASAGDASLRLQARDGLLLSGNAVTQGMGTLSLEAGGDIMLAPIAGSTAPTSSLVSQADVSLQARQIYPSTQTQFTLDVGNHAVRITGNGEASLTPLSAGGALIVKASTIEQGGVIRAPQGQIQLSASEALTVTAGSITSVSAEGLAIPYGIASGNAWRSPNGTANISQTPGKSITLDAPSVTVAQGADVNAQGGGDLLAYQFVPGRGGATDVFAGGNGVYALIPNVKDAASYNSHLDGQPALGMQIEIGAGAPVPPGTYTLLPARFALLPGAYLVEPVTSNALPTLSLGTAVTQTDGSVWVGARLQQSGEANTGPATTWAISSSQVAQARSEVRVLSANEWAAAQADLKRTAIAERPMDGGSLTIAASQADLSGQFALAGARNAEGQTVGRGGQAEFSAQNIVLSADGAGAAPEGVLQLSVSAVNAMQAQTIVLGARSDTAPAPVPDEADASNESEREARLLTVTADSVTLATAGQALQVNDLVVAARDSVVVAEGTHIHTTAPDATSGAVAKPNYVLDGDGAALRIANDSGAGLQRTGLAATVNPNHDARLTLHEGSSLTAQGGSISLDATRDTQVAVKAQLQADAITLGARTIVTQADAPIADQLALTPELLEAVAQAKALTLHGYDRIVVPSGSSLGSDAAAAPAPALGRLVLDTPLLALGSAPAAGASEAALDAAHITAQHIHLQNSTATSTATPPPVSQGQLILHAVAVPGSSVMGTGEISLGDGTLQVQGAEQFVMQAGSAIRLSSPASALKVEGDATVKAPVLLAAHGAESNWAITGQLAAQALAPLPGPTSDVASGDGAAFTAQAASVDWALPIVAPSGAVALSASSGALNMAAGAQIDVAGRTVMVAHIPVDQRGGSVALTSNAGDVQLADGVRIDVSAAGLAPGGSLKLIAPQGALLSTGAQGVGRSQGLQGAELHVDSAQAVDFSALAAQASEADPSSFSGALTVRQRSGDMMVAQGVALSADAISLQADGGSMSVSGHLSADDGLGGDGGRIDLAATGNVTLQAGALLSAKGALADSEGGRANLVTREGQITLASGSHIDVQGGVEGEGGRVELRAPQVMSPEFEPDVAIAPIEGRINGAVRVDVQGVKVYEGVTTFTATDTYKKGNLSEQTVLMDALSFVGSDGGAAERMAVRLASGNAELFEAIKIHADAEARSTDALSVSEKYIPDILINSVRDYGAANQHAAETSLTLLAQGDVTVNANVDMSTSFTDGPMRMNGGNLTVVAGADFSAASPTSTTDTTPRTLTVASKKTGSGAFITSTGDITLASSGDVVFGGIRSVAYSTGTLSSDEVLGDAYPFGDHRFTRDGGDVTVIAARDVRASMQNHEDASSPYPIHPWLSFTLPSTWYPHSEWRADPTLFQHGVASFGGGQVRTRAGRDIKQWTAISPSSGFLDADGRLHEYAGGSVVVHAGRDVLDGALQASGPALLVWAARDISNDQYRADYAENAIGLQLGYGNTSVEATARRHAIIGNTWSSYAPGSKDANLDIPNGIVDGADPEASLVVSAASGDVHWRSDTVVSSYMPMSIYEMLPGQARISAPRGNVSFDASDSALVQKPSGVQTAFDVIAGQSLHVDTSLFISASHVDAPSMPATGNADYFDGNNIAFQRSDRGRIDTTDRSPVRLVAAGGNVEITSAFASARPVEVFGQSDVIIERGFEIQHQPASPGSASELSVIHAGGDLRIGRENRAGVRIGGSGDLLASAGRNMDLGTGAAAGIQSIGNTDNPTVLPPGSANVTLVAGLRGDGEDYANAAARGFAVLGHEGLTSRSGDVYALLSGSPARASKSQAAGASVPPLGGSEAKAFEALGTADQLARVRALMGDAAYDAALASYVRGLPGNGGLSDAEALLAFASLSEGRQAAAPGALLADAFTQQDAATRQAFVAQVAAADAAAGSTQGADLQAFMLAQTGQAMSLPEAIAAFEALPMERQMLRLHTVLVDEVREQGRAAVAAPLAAEKEAHYDAAYAAINSLFPADPQWATSHGRPLGDITMPSSQVRTWQGGDITAMAPGGMLNAGELAGSTRLPSELGVVTVGGGDIAVLAQQDVQVNRSRIFTLKDGDILLWSSLGDVDAGRGAKTIVGAPPPVYRLNSDGRIEVDTSGSFSGSGIASLDAGSAIDLFAPTGAIDAGEAGIRSAGAITLGATVVRGADDIKGATVSGAPPATPAVSVTASLSPSVSPAGNTAQGDDEEERKRKRRARRNLLLEFLGFGRS